MQKNVLKKNVSVPKKVAATNSSTSKTSSANSAKGGSLGGSEKTQPRVYTMTDQQLREALRYRDPRSTKPAKNSITKLVHAKYPHGSTGRKVYNHIRGAANIAMQLAPVALKLAPFFLAAHPATQANAIAAGDTKSITDARAASSLSAGYTSSPSSMPVTFTNPFEGTGIIGTNSYEPFHSNGLVSGARIRGCDKVLDVPGYDVVTLNQWSEGDLIVSLDLNPTGSVFQGTALYQQVSVYNRYKVKGLVFIYVPSVPTSTAGGLIMSITPDPNSQYTGSGVLGAQLAMAVDGADPFSVFQGGCVSYRGDMKQKFYARPDGTDPRFTSPGILNIICNTPIQPFDSVETPPNLGSIYCLYDIEVTERSLEDSNRIQNFIVATSLVGTGFTPSLPFGAVTNTSRNGFFPFNTRGWSNNIGDAYPFLGPYVNNVGGVDYGGPMGTMASTIQYVSVGGLAALTSIPVGFYAVNYYITGTGITSVNPIVVNIGEPYYAIVNSITTQLGAGNLNGSAQYWLYVSKQTDAAESYFRISTSATTLTSAFLTITRFCDADAYNTVAPSVLAMSNLQREMNEMREKIGLPIMTPIASNSTGRRRPKGHGAPAILPNFAPPPSPPIAEAASIEPSPPENVVELGSLIPLSKIKGFSSDPSQDPLWHIANSSQIDTLLVKGKITPTELIGVAYRTSRRDPMSHPYWVIVLPHSLVSDIDTHFVHSTNYHAACRFSPACDDSHR